MVIVMILVLSSVTNTQDTVGKDTIEELVKEFSLVYLGISFLFGVFIGGFGEYYGLKFTDQRRKQKYQKEIEQIFSKVQKQMPKLIDGISAILKKNPNGRIFAALIDFTSNSILFLHDNSTIENISDIISKLRILKEYNFIRQEFSANSPKYFITDIFFNLLVK